MEYIIDRIEDNIAVLEDKDGKIFNINKDLLPEGVEGDKVIIKIEKSKNKEVEFLFKSLLKD